MTRREVVRRLLEHAVGIVMARAYATGGIVVLHDLIGYLAFATPHCKQGDRQDRDVPRLAGLERAQRSDRRRPQPEGRHQPREHGHEVRRHALRGAPAQHDAGGWRYNPVKADADMPKLPVARAMWVPQPDLKTGAGAWILAGGGGEMTISASSSAVSSPGSSSRCRPRIRPRA